MTTLEIPIAISNCGYGGYNGFILAFIGNSDWSCGIHVAYHNGIHFCRIENGVYICNTITTS
jgi:hypothetical protein